jgi:hypothetical protein
MSQAVAELQEALERQIAAADLREEMLRQVGLWMWVFINLHNLSNLACHAHPAHLLLLLLLRPHFPRLL